MIVPRIALLLCLPLLAGCTGNPRPSTVHVEPGAYPSAFEAAKASITDLGFELERVDARAGVVTTRPKPTAGLATPWDHEQSTLGHELEDFLNQHRRVVRVVFAPVIPGQAPTDGDQNPDLDLRSLADPMEARVEVAILRVRRPGWRIEPTSIHQSRRWRDPDMQARGIGGLFEEPFTLDPHLAGRLAADIARRQQGVSVLGAESPRPVPVAREPLPPPAARAPVGYWD
jgi:hypothetical protein